MSARRKPVVFAFESRVYVWRPQLVQTIMQAEPVFRRVIEHCDETVRQMLGWSLIEELAQPLERSRYNSTEELFEPTLAAVSIAQLELWRQRGLEPDAVMGLSGGEFSAAYAAGVLTLEETIRITCLWSRLLQERRIGIGSQVWVKVSWEEAQTLGHILQLDIYPTVEWSPTATIFSGETPAIEALSAHLGASGIECKRLQTKFAYHTALGWEGTDDFGRALDELRPRPPQIPIYSAASGGLLCDATFDAQHWQQMLTRPALGLRTFRNIFEDGYQRLLVIGLTSKALFPIIEAATQFDHPVQVAPSLPILVDHETPFAPKSAPRTAVKHIR